MRNLLSRCEKWLQLCWVSQAISVAKSSQYYVLHKRTYLNFSILIIVSCDTNFCWHFISYIEWTYRISHAFFWEWLFLPDARRFPSLNRAPLVTARHLRTTLLPPSESLCPLPSQASLVESKRVLVWKILCVQGKGPPPAPWLEQGVPCSEPVEDPSPSCTLGKATPSSL